MQEQIQMPIQGLISDVEGKMQSMQESIAT